MLLYLAVALVAFIGLISLGVDVGHVLLVKTQLQLAADAAARYAVAGLRNGIGPAQDNAVTAAADNRVDGSAVVIDRSSNVEFGTYDTSDHTFNVLSGSQRSSANAIRVTVRRTAASGNPVPLTFGRLIGKSTCDVTAVAIAGISKLQVYITGINGINMSGSSLIDSYDSANGTYLAGTASSNAGVASNSDISMSGGAQINGSTYDYRGTVSGGSVSGSENSLAAPLNYPVSSAALAAISNDNANVIPYMRNGSFNMSGSQTTTMPPGVYYFKDFVMSGGSVLNITGPVTIYVTGEVDISGGVMTANSLPRNLIIRVTGSGNSTFSGSSQYYGQLYAPLSDVTISGGAQFCGSIIGNTLTESGGGSVHEDLSLADPGDGGAGITTLQ